MIDLLMMPLGAFIYRMRGGMKPSLPSPVDQMLFALPYGYVTFQHSWWAGLIAFILTTIAIRKGHGNSMDLGERDTEPEWYEFTIRWLKPYMPLYWYDALGLAVSGLTYTLPAGILTLDPWRAFSGILKAPAYMISKKGGAKTEGGEMLTGAFLWGSIF
jgi:hypothetical protein